MEFLKLIWLIYCVLTPLSAIFQLYHGDQFYRWKKPEYPERTIDHGQATGKLYHLRLRVNCTFLLFTKLAANPRRIGDRLAWVVRQPNYLTHWATRALTIMTDLNMSGLETRHMCKSKVKSIIVLITTTGHWY